VQRYAIATTPSLTLTNPTPLNRQTLQVLALGVTEQTTVEEQNFPALPDVSQEIQGIAAQFARLIQDFGHHSF
jgi:CHAT domain-containing protein